MSSVSCFGHGLVSWGQRGASELSAPGLVGGERHSNPALTPRAELLWPQGTCTASYACRLSALLYLFTALGKNSENSLFAKKDTLG